MTNFLGRLIDGLVTAIMFMVALPFIFLYGLLRIGDRESRQEEKSRR